MHRKEGMLLSSFQQFYSGFLNISRCMGENTPDSPPCTRLKDTLTSISCTSCMPVGARCRKDMMLTKVLLTPINPESLSHLSRPYLHGSSGCFGIKFSGCLIACCPARGTYGHVAFASCTEIGSRLCYHHSGNSAAEESRQGQVHREGWQSCPQETSMVIPVLRLLDALIHCIGRGWTDSIPGAGHWRGNCDVNTVDELKAHLLPRLLRLLVRPHLLQGTAFTDHQTLSYTYALHLVSVACPFRCTHGSQHSTAYLQPPSCPITKARTSGGPIRSEKE